MASVHLRPAVLMVGVGRGRDRGLSLTLCVAGQGLAAKFFSMQESCSVKPNSPLGMFLQSQGLSCA